MRCEQQPYTPPSHLALKASTPVVLPRYCLSRKKPILQNLWWVSRAFRTRYEKRGRKVCGGSLSNSCKRSLSNSCKRPRQRHKMQQRVRRKLSQSLLPTLL